MLIKCVVEGCRTLVNDQFRNTCHSHIAPEREPVSNANLLRKVEALQKQNGELIDQLGKATKQLKQHAEGFAIIEAALKKCTSGDLSQAPFPLVENSARAYLRVSAEAYQYCLEMCNVKEVK